MPMMEELLRKGSGPGPHKHSWSDETFYMLDGEITATTLRRREPVTAFSPR
jgi:quercetin dioxygenase-like cupin family protein